MSRIILFDLNATGHHIQRINYLSDYLLGKGHDVTLFSQESNRHAEIRFTSKGQVRFHIEYARGIRGGARNNLPWLQLNFAKVVRACMVYAKHWDANIVHFMCIDANEVPLFLSLPRKQIGIRFFATLIKPHFLRGEDSHARHPLLSRIVQQLNNIALAKLLKKGILRRLFVLSKKTRDSLLSDWINVPVERVCVLPDPVTVLDGCCSKAEARQKLNLPLGKTIFLFFGGLRMDKGPECFLRAVTLAERQLDAIWLIAGQAEDLSEEEVLRYKSELEHPIRLITELAFIPDEVLPYYFLAADAVVLPYSKAFKGTSGVLGHAVGANRPVIATDVGEVGETVRTWDLGLTVPPESATKLAEAFVKFTELPQEKLHSYSENTDHFSRQHSWDVTLNTIHECYVRCK